MPSYYPLPVESLGGICTTACPVVLLDSASPGPTARFSYLFVDPCQTVRARCIAGVPRILRQITTLARSRWVAGYLTYEAAYAFETRLQHAAANPASADVAPAWFGVYDSPHIFDHRRNVWSRPLPQTAGATTPKPRPVSMTDTLECAEYCRYVDDIKQAIARGETYQVNFTFDKIVDSDADPWTLYLRLRHAQPAAFSAFIRTADMVVLSFSPELFFRQSQRRIMVKPMKGTAARGLTAQQDRAVCRALAHDEKNRAENVMIVDLLRNDIGRICKTARVRVDTLFEVESHPTLHQMTSTVSGTLRHGIGLSDIFAALFPCGSVTGAPKIRTMHIINDLERGPRGVYCGAIGYAGPRGRAAFSVPIRTLQRPAGERRWRYRVGSGIVWDSHPLEEWRECDTKSAFVLTETVELQLLESMLWDRHYRYLREHTDRMARSARYLGIPLTRRAFMQAAREAAHQLHGPHKVRVLADRKARLSVDAQPIEAPADDATPLALLADEPIDEREPLLYHKTTYRPWYNAAMQRIAGGECYDIIFTNRHGAVTEGARSNVFARIDGELCTPPVTAGVLPGVLRRRLIERGACRERSLNVTDLCAADTLYCGNSVRGLVAVRLRRDR